MAMFYTLLSQPSLYAAQTNLALHKKLEYSPKPAYHLTMHPRDPYLLTDRRIDKSLWNEKYREKTVGWGWDIGPFIEITVDLEQIYNVGNVNVYTIGGGRADVEYPEYIIASASLDGNQYAYSSFSSSDGWDFGANLARPQVINLPVEQRARYIKLFVRPTSSYFFTDEIEVIESKSTELQSPSDHYLSQGKITELVERARQLQRDLDVLKKRFTRSGEANAFREMEKKIGSLAQNTTFGEVTKTELEFSLFRARLLNSAYKTDWLCYQAEPMDILRYENIPPDVPGDPAISIYQWQNEYGAAALNLVNCSAGPIVFKMSLSPLRHEDGEVDFRDIFELRRAVYVRVLGAGLVADPLVLQNSEPFPVASGETVQVWLEAHSRELKAGQYAAALAISADGENLGKKLQTVPIKLEVADRIFPDKLPFSSCNWDYITISDRFTSEKPGLVKSAIADLERHYTNVVVIRHDKIFFDNKSSLLSHKLGSEIAIRDKVNPVFLMFLGGQSHLEKRFGTFRTPKWESNFKLFLAQLSDYMQKSGLGHDRFALYPFDESVGEDFVYVAKIIRDFDPRLKIYANKWINPNEFGKLKDLIDIWCPHITEVLANKARFDKYRSSGVFDDIWCYRCNLPADRFFASAKTMIGKKWRGENKVIWRTMPIVAASLEMTGAGFWAYQDANRSGWVKDKFGEYSVVYEGSKNPDKNCFPESIVPSKRWRQWRQGIEDAVCLTGNEDLLDEFFQKPGSQLTSNYLTSLRKRADQ